MKLSVDIDNNFIHSQTGVRFKVKSLNVTLSG